MEAGEELDRLIHSKVMGKPLDVICEINSHEEHYDGWICDCGYSDSWGNVDVRHYEPTPAYSTDIVAAWQIVEYMLEQDDQDAWLAFNNGMITQSWAAPRHIACVRICLTALKALEKSGKSVILP
jgi:hypothetical protein